MKIFYTLHLLFLAILKQHVFFKLKQNFIFYLNLRRTNPLKLILRKNVFNLDNVY